MMLVQICYIKRYVKPGTKYNEYQKVVEFLRLSSTTSFPFEHDNSSVLTISRDL